MGFRITGLMAAPFVPLTVDGRIAPERIPAYAARLKADGVRGVFVNGTTGEGQSLTDDERRAIAEAWIREQGDGFPVVVHVGHTSLSAAQQHAAHAQHHGATAIAAIAPYFFKPGLAGLVDWLAGIANAAPGLPLYHYHMPAMSGSTVRVADLLVAAADRVPTLAGVKYTHEDLHDFRRSLIAAGGRFDCVFGRDEILLAGLALGAQGAVGSTYNYAAPLCQRIIAAFTRGDLPAAQRVQDRLQAVVEILIAHGGGVTVGKAIMAAHRLSARCFPVKSWRASLLFWMDEDPMGGIFLCTHLDHVYRYFLEACMRCGILVLLFAAIFADRLASVEVVVHPLPATVVLRNPLKGFRPSFPDGDHPYGTVCRMYLPWNVLEPHAYADDASAIARIRAVVDGTDTTIEGWQAWSEAAHRGYRIIPRVYLLWPGKTDKLCWPADMQAYDFFSDAFVARMRTLVRRLGLALQDDPRIGGIEMGIHGLWGEQHLWDRGARYPGKNLSDMPDELEPAYSAAFNAAFPTLPIMIRNYPDFPGQAYGIHWDSFAHPDQDAHRDGILRLGDRWKTAMFGGEVAYDWGRNSAFNGASPDETVTTPVFYDRIAKYCRLLHTNHLGWVSGYDHAKPQTAVGAGIIQDALGWKFAIPEARFTTRVEAGGDLDLTLRVRNDGSSPLYQAWPVGVALLDPTTLAPVWRTTLVNADVRTWMPGSDFAYDAGVYRTPPVVNTVQEAVRLPARLARGEYLLAIALLDPAGMRPNGRFAIAAFVPGGWQPLGRIGIGQPVSNPLDLPSFTDPNREVPAYVFSRAFQPVVTSGPTATPPEATAGQTTLTIAAAAPDHAALSITWLVSGPGTARLSGNNGPLGTPVTARFSRAGNYRITAYVVRTDGVSVGRSLNIRVIAPAPQ